MSKNLDSSLLTPGVLDEYASRIFKYGACGALAIAIHDQTGWPIVAITDHHNVLKAKLEAVRHCIGLFGDLMGN